MIELFKYLLCAGGGIGIGYFLAHKVLEERYLLRIDKEVDDLRDYYRQKFQKRVEDELEAATEKRVLKEADLKKAEKELEEIQALTNPAVKEKLLKGLDTDHKLDRASTALVNYQGFSTPKLDVSPALTELIKQQENDPEPVDEPSEPEDAPGPKVPYIIDYPTYHANEGDYNQTVLTYFAGDSKVADEYDNLLEPSMVGKFISYANLAKLSEDKRTIYTRSEEFREDYEIVWSSGSYDVEVLNNQAG